MCSMQKKQYVILVLLLCIGCVNIYDYQLESVPMNCDYLPSVSGDAIFHQTVDDITLVVFERDEPFVYQYGAFILVNGSQYYLGQSLSEHFQLSKTPLTYESQPVYSYLEVSGAAYGCTRFFSFKEESPFVLMSIEGV